MRFALCLVSRSSGLLDEGRDSSRLRLVYGMAARSFNYRGAGVPGHRALSVRWNHLVVPGDQVPARLRTPAAEATSPARASTPHGTSIDTEDLQSRFPGLQSLCMDDI
jgi:hypothetical protein